MNNLLHDYWDVFKINFLKNLNFILYQSNKIAWLTQDIFKQYIEYINDLIIAKNGKNYI